MYTKIIGTGRMVPERVLSNFDLEKMVDTSDEWIRKRTGIVERRIAAPEQGVVDMAQTAALAALEDAGIAASALDLILCSTSTPDFLFPSVSARLQHRLGAPAANCCDVSAACTGYISALDIADSHIRAGKCKYALVVASEKLSGITDYTDRATCVLFGDAAAAFILTGAETPGFRASFLGCRGEGWEHIRALPGQYLTMNGREVYKFAVRIMQEAMEEVLGRAGVSMEEVRWLIPHQANLRIIESAMEKWSLPPEKVLISIPYTANTSSATIPSLYDEHRRGGGFQTGDLVLMVAFGAGLTYGAALYEV